MYHKEHSFHLAKRLFSSSAKDRNRKRKEGPWTWACTSSHMLSTGQFMGNTRKCWLGSHQRATAPGRPEVSHRVPGQAVGNDCRGVLRSYCCRVTMAQYLMSLSMFPALLKLGRGLHGDSCPSPPPREYDNFFRNVSSPPSFFFGLR